MPPLFFSGCVTLPTTITRLPITAQMHGSKHVVAVLRTVDVLGDDGALHQGFPRIVALNASCAGVKRIFRNLTSSSLLMHATPRRNRTWTYHPR